MLARRPRSHLKMLRIMALRQGTGGAPPVRLPIYDRPMADGAVIVPSSSTWLCVTPPATQVPASGTNWNVPR